jgi:5-methylcytosine-specific restriction endonuclease McrA
MRNQSIKMVFDYVDDMRKRSFENYPYMSYEDQLKTEEWKMFRLYVIIVKGFKCELCNDKNFKHFQVHHKRYIKDLFAWQYDLEDLMVLCRYHHEKVHNSLIKSRRTDFKTIKEIYNG